MKTKTSMSNTSPDEWVARLMGRSKDDESTYSNNAEYAAKVLLLIARENPEAFVVALDAFRKDPYGNDLDMLMSTDDREYVFESITGFQWGWAVNMVAWLLEQPSVPNPAILTFEKVE